MAKPEIELNPEDELTSEKQSAGVESVLRSMEILSSLANGNSAVKEIAENCQLTPSTVYRLLQTLEESGAVIRDSISHRYYLGPLIPQLTRNPQTTHQRLVFCASEDMHNLAETTRETVTLTVFFGIKHLLLYSIPSPQRLRVVDPSEPGDNEDLYLAAKGKVLLAQLSDQALKETLHYIRVNSTQNPLWTIEQMIKETEKVRKKGYAITSGVRVEGATCISVPVLYYDFPVCISILGPDSRLKPKQKEFLQMVLRAGVHVSQKVKTIYHESTAD